MNKVYKRRKLYGCFHNIDTVTIHEQLIQLIVIFAVHLAGNIKVGIV